MASENDRPAERERALALLAEFTTRVLPGILRRIGVWKGISPAALQELDADVRQELTLDCLSRPDVVLGASAAARHARWIRLAERWIYHQHVRPRRRETPADPDALAAPERHTGPDAVGEGRPPQLPRLEIVQLKNGRCNLRASAERTGTSVGAMRRQLDRLATRLRDGCETTMFWRRRLAEALTGLGADLLRQSTPLDLLPSRHAAPDPKARLRRIRRLARRFPLHVTPLEIRRTLTCWTRRPPRGPAAAQLALEQATTLVPDRAEGWLWLFEAHFAAGARAAALTALCTGRRRAARRRCGRFVLARARLLESRGRLAGAVALVARAARRTPADGRLRLALERVARPGGIDDGRAPDTPREN